MENVGWLIGYSVSGEGDLVWQPWRLGNDKVGNGGLESIKDGVQVPPLELNENTKCYEPE